MLTRIALSLLLVGAVACSERTVAPPGDDDTGTSFDADAGFLSGDDATSADLGAADPDATTSDAGLPPTDASSLDALALDATALDASPVDSGAIALDGGSADAGLVDGGSTPDAGPLGPDPTIPAFAAAQVYQVTLTTYGDTADVYYPAAQAGAWPAPYPGVVLLQGANVGRGNYSEVARMVSRFGFIVIVPDHNRAVFGVSGLFPEVGVLNAGLETLRSEGQRAGSPIFGLVDSNASAVMGHSLGGAAGVEAIAGECSSALCTNGPYTRPSSLRAGAFYGTNRKPPIGSNIPATANAGVPIMLVQGSVDGAAAPADGLTTYQRIVDPPKVFATLAGANHYSVTDAQNPPGAAAEQSAATLAQATGLDIIGRWAGIFLNAHVRRDARAADRLYNGPAMPEANLSLTREGPLPPGPDSSGSCTYDTISVTINRTGGGTMPATIWVPNNGTAPYPVVVFNPGLNIAATNYQGSLRHLASWCYAVVANGTTYSPLSVDDAAWTQDVQDMLAWVSSPTEPQVAGRFGPQRALIGHSAGAKNSLRAAGAQPSGIDALIAWDVAGQNQPTATDLSGLAGPVLLLGEVFSGNNGRFGQYCAPLTQNYQTYFTALPTNLPTLEVTLDGADHLSFLDSRGCGLSCSACPANTGGDPIDVSRKIRRYTLSWLQRFVRNDNSFDTYLFGPAMAQDVAQGGVSVRQK